MVFGTNFHALNAWLVVSIAGSALSLVSTGGEFATVDASQFSSAASAPDNALLPWLKNADAGHATFSAYGRTGWFGGWFTLPGVTPTLYILAYDPATVQTIWLVPDPAIIKQNGYST